MQESFRRNVMLGLGGIALACLVVAIVTVLLALDATALMLYAVLGVLVVVVVAEVVLLVWRTQPDEDEPVETTIVQEQG